MYVFMCVYGGRVNLVSHIKENVWIDERTLLAYAHTKEIATLREELVSRVRVRVWLSASVCVCCV